MTKKEKYELKQRIRRYSNKFIQRNKVYEQYDGSVVDIIKHAFISAYFLCYHQFQNSEGFWKPRYWVLNELYCSETERLSNQLAQAKELIETMLIYQEGFSHMGELNQKAKDFIKES